MNEGIEFFFWDWPPRISPIEPSTTNTAQDKDLSTSPNDYVTMVFNPTLPAYPNLTVSSRNNTLQRIRLMMASEQLPLKNHFLLTSSSPHHRHLLTRSNIYSSPLRLWCIFHQSSLYNFPRYSTRTNPQRSPQARLPPHRHLTQRKRRRQRRIRGRSQDMDNLGVRRMG